MLQAIVDHTQLFLLVLFRIVAMVEVAPLLSSTTVPQVAKIGLSFFAAVGVFPWVYAAGYPIPPNPVDWFLVVIGEVLIGLLIGFLLLLVFSTFQVAGQFFSLQMGFGASEVFDPLAQVEIPLIGEYLNMIAMFVFISSTGFQKFFLLGVGRSFEYLRAADLASRTGDTAQILIHGLGGLFQSALIISFPILGTLLLVSIVMGLLAKASPQMDILMMGFPFSIGVSFMILFVALPLLMTAFGRIVDGGFENIGALIQQFGVKR